MWWRTGPARRRATCRRRLRSSACFGDDAYRLAVTSPKSMTGHTTCAAGALNLLAAVCAMRDGVVSPTINFDNPDPELDLDYVPQRSARAGGRRRARERIRVRRHERCARRARQDERSGERARWTTLDRIVSVRTASREAIRNVPNTLAIFDSHFPRFPVLPGVLILGSLGCARGELLERRTGRRLAARRGRASRLPALRTARRPARAHGHAEGPLRH